MLEPEVAWNDSADNMRLQEDFVSYLVQRCLERRAAELKELERDTSALERVKAPFHRVNYTDAVEILRGKGSAITWGDDLGAEDEALLVADYDRPVFVMNYPKEAKAFYMKENPDDPRTVLCDDCLAPEGSAKTTTTTSFIEFTRRSCRSTRTVGIWIFGSTGRSCTRALDLASSERSRGFAGFSTSERRARSRE